MSRSLLAPVASMLLCLSAGAVLAQPVYRIVGPDGKVTFSDRAPSADSAAASTSAAGAGSGSAAATGLPFALQQVASRFPVTLYTGSDCAPCDGARQLLVQRGVPFTERTVSSNADIAALQRLSGKAALPFGTIGSQQLQGFSDTEWTQFLDAAGYPKQSALPASYRRPAATPLVAVQPLEPARAPEPAAPAVPERLAPANNPSAPSNPAGIRF
jgi:glutaredoxin